MTGRDVLPKFVWIWGTSTVRVLSLITAFEAFMARSVFDTTIISRQLR
jgi:hypothetical protein